MIQQTTVNQCLFKGIIVFCLLPCILRSQETPNSVNTETDMGNVTTQVVSTQSVDESIVPEVVEDNNEEITAAGKDIQVSENQQTVEKNNSQFKRNVLFISKCVAGILLTDVVFKSGKAVSVDVLSQLHTILQLKNPISWYEPYLFIFGVAGFGVSVSAFAAQIIFAAEFNKWLSDGLCTLKPFAAVRELVKR